MDQIHSSTSHVNKLHRVGIGTTLFDGTKIASSQLTSNDFPNNKTQKLSRYSYWSNTIYTMPILLMNVLPTNDFKTCAFRARRLHNSREILSVHSHRILPFVTLLPEHAVRKQSESQCKAARPREVYQEDGDCDSVRQEDAAPVQQCGTRQNALHEPKNPFSREFVEANTEADFCWNNHSEKRKSSPWQ